MKSWGTDVTVHPGHNIQVRKDEYPAWKFQIPYVYCHLCTTGVQVTHTEGHNKHQRHHH